MADRREVKNAVCTFCGCTCDDIDLVVEGDHIIKAKRACALGEAWFLNHSADKDSPAAEVGRTAVPLEDAITEAAQLLAGARYPLIYGLSNTTSEAQRLAVRLAELTGANLDTTSSVCHGPTDLALQAVGKVGCTLGEVKNRADLVIYWGCNPAEAHPRHFTRYAVTPKGEYVPNGRRDRTVILVDVRKTASAKVADLFIPIKPGKDFELAQVLRALADDRPVDKTLAEETGVSLAVMQDLIDRMKRAKYGVIFFGLGLTMTRGKHQNVAALLALVAEFNRFTRFTGIPMRGHGNVTGADVVLTWQTGYPFAVNFSRGYPRYGPGEFTAVDLLVRREVDVALVLASDPMATFPQAAREHLGRIPTIVVDPKRNATAQIARVYFETAPYGISSPGIIYRMDEVPLKLRPALPSPFPSDQEVLSRLCTRVEELKYA